MEEKRLIPGIYEEIVDRGLQHAIQNDAGQDCDCGKLEKALAPKALSQYVAGILEQKLSEIADTDGKEAGKEQLRLVNQVIEAMGEEQEHAIPEQEQAKQLLSVEDRVNTGKEVAKTRKPPVRPGTSIAASSLFTGAAHEPPMYLELSREAASADRIDMLVSFVKWSGLRLLYEPLRAFTERGKQLRVITTSYMGATDCKAVEELAKLPNTQIRISYDTDRTRLHAKAYVFHRDNGYSTAYVGSSNLSNPALTSGLEWNIKLTRQDQKETMTKIESSFLTYWNQSEFQPYTGSEADREKLRRAILSQRKTGEKTTHLYLADVEPYAYQQEILDRLEAERNLRHHYRNLVVAATGTGKTVIAALDYRNFAQKTGKDYPTLLFVAHREEILEQSIECFREVLKNPDFGDLFVGSYRPEGIRQLFLSIQTFQSKNFTQLVTPDFYDYIIVDEFHHAAADSYQKLLDYFKPKIFLGLTATPERMDGKSILPFFDGRIAAELRLPEAIDRKMLCPFQYFGLADDTDLRQVRWTRGGYDQAELSKLYTFAAGVAQKRVERILWELNRIVTDLDDVKGLGFCVSKEHAAFMSRQFNEHGIPSLCLISESDQKVRDAAKEELVGGKIHFIFVVDLYNEGVDIREVNTILFLRPTQSLTIFLQQLGRGLRLAPGKECLTVLDFVGQANRHYNFAEKFDALTESGTKGTIGEIQDGFVDVPRGCSIQLERKARDIILENINAAVGHSWSRMLEGIRTFEEDTGKTLTLEHFLEAYHLDLTQLYRDRKHSFAGLLAAAGRGEPLPDTEETRLFTAALYRIAQIDSRRWIAFLEDTFDNLETLRAEELTPLQYRMANMLQFTVYRKTYGACGFPDILEVFRRAKAQGPLYREIREVLALDKGRIAFVDQPVDLGFDCPLDLHCHYTRDQIFVALDYENTAAVRQGVLWVKEHRIDVLINTLNKTEKDYSPSTMYEDYSINEHLFHWQSQVTTSADSPTGQRYIHHDRENSQVILFVKEYKKDAYGHAAPFVYLGKAHYLSHEGSRPMSIIWRLEEPIPADFIRKSGKLTAQ
jgi:superfamily II DNA or RNA helicase/HKD family nuclease